MNFRKTPAQIALIGTGLFVCSLSQAGQSGVPITLKPSQLSVTVLPSPLSAKKEFGYITRKAKYHGVTIEEMLSMIPATKQHTAKWRANEIKGRIDKLSLSHRRISLADIQYHDDPKLPTIGIGAYKKGEHIITVDPLFAAVRHTTQRELGSSLRADLYAMLTKPFVVTETTVARLTRQREGHETQEDANEEALTLHKQAEEQFESDKAKARALWEKAEKEALFATTKSSGYPAASITLARIRLQLNKPVEAAEALLVLDDSLSEMTQELADSALDNLKAIPMDKLSEPTKKDLKALKIALEKIK